MNHESSESLYKYEIRTVLLFNFLPQHHPGQCPKELRSTSIFVVLRILIFSSGNVCAEAMGWVTTSSSCHTLWESSRRNHGGCIFLCLSRRLSWRWAKLPTFLLSCMLVEELEAPRDAKKCAARRDDRDVRRVRTAAIAAGMQHTTIPAVNSMMLPCYQWLGSQRGEWESLPTWW